MVPTPRRKFYFSIGPGLRLVSEEHFLEQLRPLGMTVRGFRSLCRCLGVPLIFIGPVACVELTTMQLALRYVTRIGRPDFRCPGSDPANKEGPSRITLDEYETDLARVVAELLYAKKADNRLTTKEIVDAATEAARILATAGALAAAQRSRRAATRYT